MGTSDIKTKTQPPSQPVTANTSGSAASPASPAKTDSPNWVKSSADVTASSAYAPLTGKSQFTGATASVSSASSSNPNGRAADASNGTEAADRLKNSNNYFGPEAKWQQSQDFLKTLQEHKGDPQWMSQLYKGLGPQQSAALIAQLRQTVVNDNHNTFPDAKSVQATFAAVSQSLGQLDDATAAAITQEAAKDPNSAVAMGEVLRQDGARAYAREMFINDLVINGKATAAADPSGNDMSPAQYAMAASEAMANDPTGHLAASYLGSLDSGTLKNFVDNATTFGPNTNPETGSFGQVSMDGFQKVVASLANVHSDQPGFPLRAQLLKDVALDVGVKSDQERKGDFSGLIDAEGALFRSDPQKFTEALFNDKADPSQNAYDESLHAMSYLFRDTVFANPDPNGATTKAVFSVMQDLRAKATQVPTGANADQIKGDDNYYGKVLGDLAGSLQTGYARAVKDNGQEQASRATLIKALYGATIDPLTSKLIPSFPGSDAVVSSINDSVQGAIVSFINRDLENTQQNMDSLFQTLSQGVFSGFRDFDRQYDVGVEDSVKTEWGFVRQQNEPETVDG